ncbi:hypothetical protein [Erwinia sp. Leaf53]|uniref:hypothetical protein n=1 Tax=Erwinia sp. Leaf53 TaxID=1736225 RepID=UPI0006FF8B9A|nr:hypothetical protein [Erwinia sp. Leaf53]KQN53169.1 hypothetical protein ASF13_16345 [Erwinia sp. Leaf53]
MTTLTFVYLILASPVRDGSAWSITPMPSMAVCQQVLADVRSHTGSWSDDSPRAPAASYCKEVKQ